MRDYLLTLIRHLRGRLRGQVLYFNIQLPLRPHPSDEIQDLTP